MYAIETSGITFSYTDKPFIKNLALKVPNQSIYGFLGSNGAGKTTIIKILTGLLSPQKGSVFYKNRIYRDSEDEIKEYFGTLIETPSLYEHLSARENMKYLNILYGNKHERIDNILNIVGLQNSTKKVKNFSQGMKQRLGLAFALYNDPEILILDEPTNGLDPNGIIDFRNLLINLCQNYGKTIFISSHTLSEVEKLCTHIGIIENGTLVLQGEITEVLSYGIKKYTINTDNNKRTYSILNEIGMDVQVNKTNVELFIRADTDLNTTLKILVEQSITIREIRNRVSSLEELFLGITKKK